MLVQGQVGLASVSDGSNPTLALGRQGHAMVSELHGRYYELAARGLIFHLPAANVTVVAASVTPLAAGTGQPITGLYNPLGSAKNLVILKSGITTVSGTPGGPLTWNFAANQNISATPNAFPVPSLLSQSSQSVTRGFSNVAMTGMTACAAIRDAVAISAVAAGSNTAQLMEDMGGDIIVPPGCFFGLGALAVGTSHVVRASLTWSEIPA